METNINRTADDIHLTATPFRLIRNLIVVSLVILSAPLLLIWLIVASHLQPQDCGIAKFMIGVFGPIVFCVWFAGVVRWYDRRKKKYPAIGSELGRSRASGLAAYFCGVGYLGVLASMPACYYLDISGVGTVWIMVLGLFSPAIQYAIVRMLRS
jgi:hypothetical protein